MKTRSLGIGNSAAVLAALGAVFIAGTVSAADPAKLVIASYGGSFQDAQTRAFFDPYAKVTGTKLIGTTGTGYAKVKAMVASGNVTWDVISADGDVCPFFRGANLTITRCP